MPTQYDLDEQRRASARQLGFLGMIGDIPGLQKSAETMVKTNRRQDPVTAQTQARPKHIGQGWFQNPDGTVQQNPDMAQYHKDKQEADLRQEMEKAIGLEKVRAAFTGGLGAIPGSYERTEVGGTPVDRPLPGSKDYAKATGGLQDLYRGINNVQDMISLVGQHGTEAFGPKSSQMSSLYGDIMAAVAEAQNKGVLQQGEMEQIQKGLPNPGDWANSYRSADSILAGYQQVLNQLNSKLAAKDAQFKQWGYEMPTNPRAAAGQAAGQPGTDGIIDLPTPK